MTRKSLIITATVTVVTIFIIRYWWLASLFLIGPYMGDTMESWETSNQTFKLRIDEHAEVNGGFVPGAYYVYQTTKIGSDDWKEIFTIRHDDPNPIIRNSVQFIDSQIGYVYFEQKYAVTMDAGETWTEWDAWEADKNMQFKQYGLYPSIKEVHLDSDGHGRMRLYPTSKHPVNKPELKTNDYGRNWTLE